MTLGAIQVLGFTAQEILERFLASAPMSDVGAVLLAGIPLQLPAAAAGALLVAALHKAGTRLASLLTPRPHRQTAPVLPLPRSISYSSAITSS